MSSALSALASGLMASSRWACRATEGVLFGLGAGMALLLGLQVFSRYALNHSLFWSEEIGRICLVWIAFLGASAAYKRQAHIGIDFFVRRLPEPVQKGAEVLVLLASLVFFTVLIVFGVKFVGFVAGQKTAALGIPVRIPYLVVPVSGALFMLHALSRLFELFQAPAGRNR